MLTQAISRYLDQQRALGFKYRVQGTLLHSFSRFAERQGDTWIQTPTVLAWAGQAPSAAQRRNRLLTVRRCAITLQVDDPRHQLPPVDAFGQVQFPRQRPFIFTPEQRDRLLQAAAQLLPSGSLRPATYTTLFALLAVTGLRISEALALTLDDITDDGLLIRATKFRKDRLVPLHETAHQALDRYRQQRATVASVAPNVFVSRNGTALAYSTVNATFLRLVRSIGLHPGPGQPGPRLHDLRHTFAVCSLAQCAHDRAAVARQMVGLSTYLGHAHLSDTYWYLHATPTLLDAIANAGEALYRGMPS